MMLADASRHLYKTADTLAEKPAAGRGWTANADTRKMTLKEYREFLSAQQARGGGG